jgi:MFS family permease
LERTAADVPTTVNVHPARRRNLVLLSLAFASFGTIWGAQQAVFAELQRDYGFDESTLGLLLLLPPLIGVPVALAASRILTRIGPATLLGCGAVVVTVGQLTLALGDGRAAPWVAMLILGAGAACVDVGVLTSGSRVQSGGGPPVLGRIQSVFFVGLVAGGGIGVAIVGLGLSYRVSFVITALLLLAACASAVRWLDLPPARVTDEGHLSLRAVLAIAGVPVLITLAFGGFFLEGAVTSFAAVLLRTELESAAVVASTAAFVVTAGLAVGAYAADAMTARIGARRTMAVGAAIATVGVAAAATATVSGLGIASIGFGGIGPAALTLTAPIDHEHGGGVLPTVTALSYLAFLFGPVVVGQLGQLFGLRVAFGVVAAMAAALAVVSLVALRPRTVPA